MKRYIKNVLMYVCLGMFAGLTSCSDMLDSDSSRQVFEPNLSEKTDSVYYALGVLQAMQQLADQYVFQGEMRGDLVKTTVYTDNNLRQLADFSATVANKYDSAYVYYRVINNCNYYIAHRDTTLRTGSSYVAMNEYVAIKAIRAWAYMQLARVYGKVPFYTTPLTQISQIDNNNFPELDMAGIVAQLAPDLEQYTGYGTPKYGTAPAGSDINSDYLFMPVDVVLGDMYLETEQFDKAASHYITYLTEVSAETSKGTAYSASYASRGRGGVIYMDELPSDWDFSNFGNQQNTTQWTTIFTSLEDVITYIPMAANSLRGATTGIPLAFGYDYYATDKTGNSRYVDEIQIAASDSYLDLSDNQEYYYVSSLSSTTAGTIINSAKLGDTRYNSIIREDEDADADTTIVWIRKYVNPRVYLYRNSTVLLHLAEAFNRLGMYDAAFAILKDGINEGLTMSSSYLSAATQQALTSTYPLLSDANKSKFSSVSNFFGVHTHGAGYTGDRTITSTSIVVQPYLSPYQPDTILGLKMKEIAAIYNVNVGTSRQDSINAMEDVLCDEYALELAFEGSRFYDLCRLARHKNKAGLYDANFGGKWLARKLAYKNPVVNLEDEKNWYLPFK